jgi:hypothetical protein
MLRRPLHVTTAPTCGLSVRRLPFKWCSSLSLRHSHVSAIYPHRFCSSSLLSLTMARFEVKRVRAAVWKWLCRCPDAIGPVGDTSSDDEFFTPPTSPVPTDEQRYEGSNSEHGERNERSISASSIIAAGDAQRLLSPAQTRRLRRRHAEVVRQLTTPPPLVAPRPQSPLKAYQRPTMVYRPRWAP